MAAEVILRVKVDRSQYNAFKTEVQKGIDTRALKKQVKPHGRPPQRYSPWAKCSRRRLHGIPYPWQSLLLRLRLKMP